MSISNVQTGRPYDVMLDKEIADLAHQYWEMRGRPLGSPEVDWYRAVEEVNNRELARRKLGLR
jgi:hypothetical protein